MSDHCTSDRERSELDVECGINHCEERAEHLGIDVEHEDDPTRIATANLCPSHFEKLDRYNRGEEVDWDE